MPQKKKKYNARFPPGRIKKIMQTDEDVGKVAAAVPIMISRTLELFVESLLAKTMEITNERQARTLSPSHMKQCIMSESRFDFLRDLVSEIPNINWAEDYPSQGEGPEPPPPVAAVPPVNGNTPLMRQNSLTQPVDRPRRHIQRPGSYDSFGESLDNSTASSSADQSPFHAYESPTGILKRKLLDPARKAASTETPNRNHVGSKLVRLDSSPAAFNEIRKGVPRRRKSNEACKQASVVESPLATVNLSADALGTAMVQIIPDGHSSGCKVNVDFSKLISPVALTADTSAFNGVNKLLLNPAAVEAKSAALSTPNLTTPTGLNYAPPFPVLSNTSPAAFPAPEITTSSSLQMDEDYDDL